MDQLYSNCQRIMQVMTFLWAKISCWCDVWIFTICSVLLGSDCPDPYGCGLLLGYVQIIISSILIIHPHIKAIFTLYR